MHSHLLPGIDDGVQSLSESMNVIQELKKLGYKKLITTPHVISNYYPNSPEIIRTKLAEVRSELDRQNIEIEIDAAAEYFLDDQFIQWVDDEVPLLTFGDKYLLVETGFMNKPAFFNDAIFRLKSQGYKPILAHPERYQYIQEDFEQVESILSTGVLFQINLLSLIGYYSPAAKKLAEHLINSNQFHFLGSDSHNMKQASLLSKVLKTKSFKKAGQLSLLNSAL